MGDFRDNRVDILARVTAALNTDLEGATAELDMTHRELQNAQARIAQLEPPSIASQKSLATEPSRPPRRRQATRAERPAAAGLAAAAAWLLAPIPPRHRPSSRWQGAGVHPLID
jgi:ferric-dicitrate binding protein FerR (iron transport regulator)